VDRLIEYKCEKCGFIFEIYRKTALRKLKCFSPFLCKKCMSERRSELGRNQWNNLSYKEKNKILDRLRHYYDRNPEVKDKMIEYNKSWYNNLSQEEKDKYNKKAGDWYNKLSDEEKKLISIRGKKQWDDLSEEEKDKIRERSSKQRENMTDEEFNNFMYKIYYSSSINTLPNKTEEAFIDLLNSNSINFEFQYVSKIKHPDFDRLFPKNPITGGRVYFAHRWDFIIHTKRKDILIDIDGSIHEGKNTKVNVKDHSKREFILSDIIKFNEIQRPYQTDGLDAYIIKAYNDKIEDGTIVSDVENKNSMTVKELISLINSFNLTDLDLITLLKYCKGEILK